MAGDIRHVTILLPALGGRCRIRYPHSGMRGAVTLPFRCLFCRNPLGLTRGACTAQPGAPASSEPPPTRQGIFYFCRMSRAHRHRRDRIERARSASVPCRYRDELPPAENVSWHSVWTSNSCPPRLALDAGHEYTSGSAVRDISSRGTRRTSVSSSAALHRLSAASTAALHGARGRHGAWGVSFQTEAATGTVRPRTRPSRVGGRGPLFLSSRRNLDRIGTPSGPQCGEKGGCYCKYPWGGYFPRCDLVTSCTVQVLGGGSVYKVMP